MIKSFNSKALKAFHQKGETRKLPVQNHARVAEILSLLNAATRPEELNVPGYYWHPLGDMAPGGWSMRVTGNWRITFDWEGNDAIDVDIIDYH